MTHPSDRVRTSERFATGAWLSGSLMTFTAGIMIAGTVVGLGFLLISATGTVDVYGRPVGTDFSSFWSAGVMALAGHAPQSYDWSAHSEVLRQWLGTKEYYPWSYPPVFLLVAAALAMLPYLPALVAWQATTMLAVLGTLWAIVPRWRALMLGIGFPGVLICLGHGQTGFLTAALLTGGILALARREVLAGVLFGLLVYKPQFGLLLPFILAAGGYWRAFAAAAVTALVVVAVTLFVWGWPVWQAFLNSTHLTRTIVFETGDTGFEKFQSAFAWMRLWGGSLTLAYGLQAVVATGVLISCIRIWRGDVDLRLKGAALLVGTLLSSPYVLDYDFIPLGMAIALVAAHGLDRGFQPWDKTLLAIAWFTPLVARTIAKSVYLPVGFLMLAALFVLIVVRARGMPEVATPGLRVSGGERYAASSSR